MRAEFVCPACRKHIAAPPSLEGRAVACPKCMAFVSVWPPPVVPAPAAPAPPPTLSPPPPSLIPPRPQVELALAYHPAAIAAWAVAAVIAFAGVTGCVGILATGDEQRRELEAELKKLEAVERQPYYDPWGTADRDLRRIKDRATDAIAKDRRVRSQAVANVVFATIFEVAAFIVAGVFILRPPSPLTSAGMWGAVAGGVLGLVGALLSQFAPMFGGLLARFLTTPFSAAQLTFLSEHTLTLGLIGVALGAGASALRVKRSGDSP